MYLYIYRAHLGYCILAVYIQQLSVPESIYSHIQPANYHSCKLEAFHYLLQQLRRRIVELDHSCRQLNVICVSTTFQQLLIEVFAITYPRLEKQPTKETTKEESSPLNSSSPPNQLQNINIYRRLSFL